MYAPGHIYIHSNTENTEAPNQEIISEEPTHDDQPTPSLSLSAPKEEDWSVETPAEDLSEFVVKDGNDIVSGGGFGDVYKGIWSKMDTNSNIFMKTIRVLGRLNDRIVAIKVIRPLVPDGRHRDALKRVSEPVYSI